MFVGGALKTLLYMAQLAAISMDPWFSTMDDWTTADQVAIDLDPQPGATFSQILDVARWVHDELDRLKVPGFPKTSGSEGLHIFIPLPPGTSYEAGMLFCQIIATIVAAKHPKVATVERMVRRRKDGTIYVDYLQNIPGKTLACAYSARASAFAGVSTPLTWKEVDGTTTPQDFTIKTIEARVKKVGDLWAADAQAQRRRPARRDRQTADVKSIRQFSRHSYCFATFELRAARPQNWNRSSPITWRFMMSPNTCDWMSSLVRLITLIVLVTLSPSDHAERAVDLRVGLGRARGSARRARPGRTRRPRSSPTALPRKRPWLKLKPALKRLSAAG